MNLLLRQAIIIDPSSPFHQQEVDVFIQDGIIRSIATDLDIVSEKTIQKKGMYLSAGWLDVFAHFPDPGFEFKESLETGSRAAAAGGFTDVLLVPNTAPVVQNKSAVEYIVQRSKGFVVNLHPIGAITKNAEGKELAEMYDMYNSGAAAFGDGTCTVQSSGILLKALQYLKAIDKVLIQLPDDRSISAGGLMNEGIVSTQLGLPGKPAIAEELMIARDIELAKYTESKIHITGVSTAKSIALIERAKAEGIRVTCSVAPYHLFFSDEDLVGYDSNLKLNPPLRTIADRDALRKAVLDGTVDCIASHHLPHETDSKVLEFEYAKYGMIGLETAFAVVRTSMPQLPIEKLITLFSNAPRSIFDLPVNPIKENNKACLTLFTDENWIYNEHHIQSKSRNTPFRGKELKGRPLGIINKDQLFLNEDL
jgi:dihydroorotase